MEYGFLVLQSCTGGGHALLAFLNDHPSIHVPNHAITDHLIETGREQHLRVPHVEPLLLPPWPNGYTNGIILHTGAQLHAGMPARLAGLFRPRSPMIQMVRSVFDAVVASQRRRLLVHFMDQVGRRMGRDPIPNAPDRIWRQEELFDTHRERCQFHRQGMRYAASFGEWHVVDSSDLRPERIDETMKSLYGIVGVDTHHSSELFRKDIRGFVSRMFYWSRQSINCFGYDLALGLEYASNVRFVHDDLRLEVLRLPSVSGRVPFAMRDEELAVVSSPANWYYLPEKLRRHLVEEGALRRVVEEELLPRWIEATSEIHERVMEHWQPEIEPRLARRLAGHFGDDYARLFRIRPDLEEQWGWRWPSAVATAD